MHIEALKLFCGIIRFRSFSDSAQAHSVSQPAASQTVQAPEERLGLPLIDRSCRPWRLTSEGEFFYHGCRDILRRYESLEVRVKGLSLAILRRRGAPGNPAVTRFIELLKKPDAVPSAV